MSEIIHGDSIQVLETMKPDSVQMVITSPPYNVGIEYGNGHNDNLPEQEYYDWCGKWIAGCYRVLCEGGRIAINIPNVGNTQAGKSDIGLQTYVDKFIPLLKNAGFTLRELITWVKSNKDFDESNFCGNNTAWGSWLSPSNPQCRSFSEMILVAHKGSAKRAGKGEPDITKEEFMRYTRNVWFMPTVSSEHPAPFHEELPYRLIRLYTYPGDIVLDPFTGSGTTLFVAQKLGRNWIGIEQNAEYVKMANKRIDRIRYQTNLTSLLNTNPN